MDLETERQFFRAAMMILLVRLHQNGGKSIGFIPGPPVIWLIGEVDNWVEMQMILEEERKWQCNRYIT